MEKISDRETDQKREKNTHTYTYIYIYWTEELGRLQFMGLKRVDKTKHAHTHTHTHTHTHMKLKDACSLEEKL